MTKKATLQRSLSIRFPKVAKEWNHVKNPQDFKPENTYPYSAKKAYWVSGKHFQSVKSRVVNIPKVPNKQAALSAKHRLHEIENLLRVSSLAIICPDVASQWDYSKNNGLTPHDFMDRSGKSASWVCDEGHTWDAKISNRTTKRSGCPDCYQNSKKLYYANPLLAREYHPTRNTVDVKTITKKANTKVWWLCPDCGHDYEATVRKRANGYNCTKCKPAKVHYHKSAAFTHPIVVKEWHPTRNGIITPLHVTSYSATRVWFQCRNNPKHEWETILHNRTANGTGCPHCNKEKRLLKKLKVI